MVKLISSVTFLVILGYCKAIYILGGLGQSCWDACFQQQLNCNPAIETFNTTKEFNVLGIQCKASLTPWYAEEQPAYISDREDPNYGYCVGYTGVPTAVTCAGAKRNSQRLCRCSSLSEESKTAAFGTGYSGGFVDSTERTMFAYILPPGVPYAAMTHFWTTSYPGVCEATIYRYYFDNEETPSIAFFPHLAAGVGFSDQHSPWGNRWFGKGAAGGAWYNNFKLPFNKNVRVTVQSTNGSSPTFYIIVRGIPNLKINVGGVDIPTSAKMKLHVFNRTVSPIDWVPIVDIANGSGYFWMQTLSVRSGTLRFLEGCFHQYSPYTKKFPGVVLSTGTEDYFDSAWYFNAGEFWQDNAGLTHMNVTNTTVTWSAYRFHEMDPILFDKGLLIHWRNGDVNDASNMKCYALEGIIIGNVTDSQVVSYA